MTPIETWGPTSTGISRRWLAPKSPWSLYRHSTVLSPFYYYHDSLHDVTLNLPDFRVVPCSVRGIGTALQQSRALLLTVVGIRLPRYRNRTRLNTPRGCPSLPANQNACFTRVKGIPASRETQLIMDQSQGSKFSSPVLLWLCWGWKEIRTTLFSK